MNGFDMNARRVIEALRSGVPSRAVGKYFSEARPKMMKELSDRLNAVCEEEKSSGMIISGKYGEGKTHLLNTVFSMAHENNMVVSFLTISKESPFDKLPVVYKKLMESTYLPGRQQPGVLHRLDEMSVNGLLASEMARFAAKELETDKLYYLFRACLATDEEEEKYQLKADLEGDLIANPVLKKIYKRIFNSTVKYNVNFSKTKHMMDYFSFMSHLFRQMGFGGWVILVDEVELTGRMGKKARLNTYRNMANFLMPERNLECVFTLFALSASYAEDVIEAKHELQNLDELFPDNQEPMRTVINLLVKAPQLNPLSKDEIRQVVERIIEFHGEAYSWQPGVDAEDVLKEIDGSGYLLRTKLRSVIEVLDQLYQYGNVGSLKIGGLAGESYDEDVASLEILNEE